MLVLVAVNEPNNPFDLPPTNATVEGELVVPSRAEGRHSSDCECNRNWIGLASDGMTRVAMVADRPGVSQRDLRNVIREHLVRIESPGEQLDDLVDEQLRMLGLITGRYPTGAILTRLDAIVSRRAHAA